MGFKVHSQAELISDFFTNIGDKTPIFAYKDVTLFRIYINVRFILSSNHFKIVLDNSFNFVIASFGLLQR